MGIMDIFTGGTVKAVGNVAIYLISIISDAIIPLINTVTGATVNEKICENIRMIKLRLNIRMF